MRFIAILACLTLVTALTAATLSNPRRVGAGFEFSILSASNVIYALEASRDLQNWTMVATNRQFGEARMISIVSTAQEEFYRVRLLRPLFTGALAVRESINFSGGGVRVDSFDSTDPSFFLPDGSIDMAKMRDHAAIITSSALTNSLLLGNAKIRGVLRMPPGNSPVLGIVGSVGSSAWVNGGQLGIEPGHLIEETNRVFADAELPQGSAYVTPEPGFVGTNYYTYVLSNGNYTLPELRLGSRTMAIAGRAILYVPGLAQVSGGIRILPDASLNLYVGGPSATLGGVMSLSRSTAAFAYYGLPGNTNLSVGGNGAFVGTIYAPAAHVRFSGGGADELDLFGAVVGRNITINGKMGVHYDEHLGVAGPAR